LECGFENLSESFFLRNLMRFRNQAKSCPRQADLTPVHKKTIISESLNVASKESFTPNLQKSKSKNLYRFQRDGSRVSQERVSSALLSVKKL